MKILICTDNFYPGVGGTEAACFGLANELAKEHDVMVACPDYHRPDPRSYPYPIVRMPSYMMSKNEPSVLTALAGKKFKELIAFAPDVIHLQSWTGMAKLALRLKRETGAPLVMTMHTKLRDVYLRSMHSRLITRCYERATVKKMLQADAVTTVADVMREELTSYGYPYSDTIDLVKNGAMFEREIASDEERRAARARFRLPAEAPVLLFVGHIAKFKRVDFLLAAFDTAVKNGFDGRLMLVGRGMDSTRYEKLSEKLGLADRVLFTGQFEDRADLKAAYAAADLFLMASTFDNDPIVIVEAASRGVPSLVVEHTGCSERITNGKNGFVAPSDEAAYAARIIELCADREMLRAVGRQAADDIPSTWKTAADQYLGIYRRVSAPRG